jgi:hypothetical protein
MASEHRREGVEEGRSPSYDIFPFPSGEGDKEDGAVTTEQGMRKQRENTETPIIV